MADNTAPPAVKVGLVAGGLGAYWPQFPDLLPQLKRSAERVSERMRGLGAEVVDVGFISDAQEARRRPRGSARPAATSSSASSPPT